jgi:AcrR family transcriptional regulator
VEAQDPKTGELQERAWARLGRFLRRVPRQDRARSVVSAILDAAEDELEGPERGSLQSLFARAGVAAGSFYEYFASRDDLLGAVVERVTDRNFETFLRDIDREIARDAALEEAVQRVVQVVVARYMGRPMQLRAVVRLIDRLGLNAHVVRERDRFADAVALRTARLTPDMSPAARSAMMRAAADGVTGVVFVSAFRAPPPPVDDVARAAGDVAWGVIRAHLDRARATASSAR